MPNRCTNGYGRINTAYRECGDVNAPTMLALAVEEFTGISVDNFAIFDFEGFEAVPAREVRVDSGSLTEILVELKRKD